MKKQSFTAISKKIATVILATFILSAATQKLYAFPDLPVAKSAEISYKGIRDNKLGI